MKKSLVNKTNMYIGQARRSRARPHQQRIPGFNRPDHEVRPWEYLITCPPPQAGDRCWVPLAPLHPFPPCGQPGQGPTTPLHRATPSARKLSSRIDLGENLVLASKSGSEVMVRAQDDRMKHFCLNGISLRGQTAELETSAD